MEYTMGSYEVAVIGAGHAGIEAALAAARLGCQDRRLHHQSWTPSATCPATPRSAARPRATWCGKSTRWAARWAQAADATFLQSRMLNRGKGPAVHSLRVQIGPRAPTTHDDEAPAGTAAEPGASSRRRSCDIRLDESGAVREVVTQLGAVYRGQAVIICHRHLSAAARHLCGRRLLRERPGRPCTPPLGLSDALERAGRLTCAASRPEPRPGCCRRQHRLRQAGGAGGGRADHPLLLRDPARGPAQPGGLSHRLHQR